MKPADEYYDAPLADSSPLLRGFVVVARYVVRTIFKVLFRMRYEGTQVFDSLPRDKGVIVAGNHCSYTDPIFVFDALWPRRIRFMAKGQLFDNHTFLRYILAFVGVFPVYADVRGRKAIKRSIAMIKRGENVGIFPEGTRVKKRDKTGVEHSDGMALIAKMADAIIVPVGIQGTLDISPDGSKRLHFPKVTLRFGQPLDWHDFAHLGKNDMLTALTDETMRRVYALAEGNDPGPTPASALEPREQGEKEKAKKPAAQDEAPAAPEAPAAGESGRE